MKWWTCNEYTTGSGGAVPGASPDLATPGADGAAVLRHSRLRQLCAACAGEASGPRADGLQDVLTRAAGSAVWRAQRWSLLLRFPVGAGLAARRPQRQRQHQLQLQLQLLERRLWG